MEGPVLTSASSHRLRSAVSACAQSTHSYFTSSSYLGTRIQYGSHNSGGCIRKFHSFGKGGESRFFDKLNGTKKPDGNNETSVACKRRKLGDKSCLNHYCGFRIRPSAGKKKKTKEKNIRNGNEIENLSGTEFQGACDPGQFALKRNLIPKLTLNGTGAESKRLGQYLSGNQLNESNDKRCENLIATSGNNKITLFNGKRNKCNGRCIARDDSSSNNNNNNKSSNSTSGGNDGTNVIVDRNPNSKLLHYSSNKRGKVKTKNNKKNCVVSIFATKKVAANEDRIIDQCYKCDVRGYDVLELEDFRNENQEISKWLPKHVVTRRTAQIVREIRNAWENRVGSSKLVPAENVHLLFNDLHLFPSASQVAEMLKCAQECSKNPSSKHLTFGEFYKFANDLIRTDCRITSTSPSTRVLEKNVEKRRGKFSRGMSRYEVFLGGSCNPTTWRTDIAIPELEKMNITYYNPQVEEWRPELLEVEYQAKENATLMFFVLDNQTRGVSALIEVAHLAGNQRKLILVIQSYTQKNQIICDEHISQKEYEDLKTGQEVLQKLVERQRIPVYSDIKVALKSTENILREDLRTQDMHPSTATREFHLEPRDVFDKLDSDNSGKILLRETCLALRLLQRKNVSLEQLETMVRNLGYNLNGGNLDDAKIDYESFLRLMNEFETHQESGPFLDSTFLTCSSNFPCDVYLGGTLENTEWRETIAIPMLTLENLSYFTPKANGGRKQFTDVDAFAIESSYALLFVITGTARSIAAMAIAGHYIGRGANVVLCVQHLPEGAQLGSEVLSDRAIKDYNRGRMYLTDIAKRSGVSVFDEIPEAVESVVKKCAANRSRKYCFVTDGVRE